MYPLNVGTGKRPAIQNPGGLWTPLTEFGWFHPVTTPSVVLNPPACRRVLWIVLVSIACVGFNLRFVSPRGCFDSLTPPPPPPLPLLSTSKVVGLRHVDRWIRIDNL